MDTTTSAQVVKAIHTREKTVEEIEADVLLLCRAIQSDKYTDEDLRALAREMRAEGLETSNRRPS